MELNLPLTKPQATVKTAQNSYRIYPLEIFKGKNPFVPEGAPGPDTTQYPSNRPQQVRPRTLPAAPVEPPPKVALRYIKDVPALNKLVSKLRREPRRRSLTMAEKDLVSKAIDFDQIAKDIKADPKYADHTDTPSIHLAPLLQLAAMEPIVLAQAPLIGAAAVQALSQLMLWAGPLIAAQMWNAMHGSLSEKAEDETRKNTGGDAAVGAEFKPQAECDENTRRSLQVRVEQACRSRPACRGDQELPVLRANLAQWEQCLTAREEMRRTCYPNTSDEGHLEQIKVVKNAVSNCKRFIARQENRSSPQPSATLPRRGICPLNGTGEDC